jgi:prevent-host-death family protein
MKKMAAGSFKTHCLAIMDEVQAKHETVVITKHGKPVAKLVPVEAQGDDIFGFLCGKVAICAGTLIGPMVHNRGEVPMRALRRKLFEEPRTPRRSV